MCVAGLSKVTRDPTIRACDAALAIKKTMDRANAERRKLSLQEWRPRIVLHSGSMVAGLIGEDQASFDIWGSGVSIAGWLLERCHPGEVNISEAVLVSFPDISNLRMAGVSMTKK
jgi:adenylate cyclase